MAKTFEQLKSDNKLFEVITKKDYNDLIVKIEDEFTTTGSTSTAYVDANVLQKVKVSLSATDIIGIGTTAIDVLAAQGAGTVINILSCAVSLTYGTTAFDTNDLILVFNGGSTNIVTISGLLDDTSDNFRNCAVLSGDNNLVANAKIQVTGTDSVAAGDSTIDLYITYEVITL